MNHAALARLIPEKAVPSPPCQGLKNEGQLRGGCVDSHVTPFVLEDTKTNLKRGGLIMPKELLKDIKKDLMKDVEDTLFPSNITIGRTALDKTKDALVKLFIPVREKKCEIIEGETTAEASVKLAERLRKAGVI